MSEEARAILDAARKLPPEEQSLVAEALLDGLDDGLVHVSEEEFSAELERRDAEMEQGLDKGIPWETLRDEK